MKKQSNEATRELVQAISMDENKKTMKTTYSVIVDTNTSSTELKSGFTSINEAIDFAFENLIDTNPENDSEGINIYCEDGMIVTMSKANDNEGYYQFLNPMTQMPVSETIYRKF